MNKFCFDEYNKIFKDCLSNGENEREAQRKAIRDTTIFAMKKYPSHEVSDIWKSVYTAHMDRKSGISDVGTIQKVVSAENSWKKSSGHAFEEMITILCNDVLVVHNIRFILQKELSTLLKAEEINNEVRDISWLKEQTKSSIFDLYAVYRTEQDEKYVFGCIQSKTSIRDRVTRDREPSIIAMQAFFWSIAITLDGEFLALPKFKEMVNGSASLVNGWHGMYVFSDQYSCDRIYSLDTALTNLVKHSIKAAEEWRTQRQWLDHTWRADK